MIILIMLAAMVCSVSAQTIPQWQSVHQGSYTASVSCSNLSCVDGVHGAAVSSTLGFDSVNVVQLTDDGGRTWRNVRYGLGYNVDPKTFKPLEGWWKEQYYQSVCRPSADTILVLVGRRPKNDPDGSPFGGTIIPHIDRSTDGGATWTEIAIQTPTQHAWFANYMAMDDRSVGYCVGPDPADTVQTRLFKTTDAGATWTMMPYADFTSQPRGLRARGASIVYAWLGQDLWFSTDGGTSFTVKQLPAGTIDVNFVNATNGVAVGGVPTGVGQQQTAKVWAVQSNKQEWFTLLDTVLNGSEVLSVSVTDKGSILAALRHGILHRDAKLRTWEIAPFPYGTSGLNAGSVRWTANDRAMALLVNNIIYFTGARELTAVKPTWSAGASYQVGWQGSKDDVRYHLQVAARPQQTPMGFDYALFDTATALVADTMVTDAVVAFAQLPKGKDVYARVRRFTAKDSSGWSEQAIIRIPAEPPLPSLDLATLLLPEHDAVMHDSVVTFTWSGDSRTATYDLLITSRGTYQGAWDDSIAHNVRGLTTTTATVALPRGKTYWWYVLQYAEGFSVTASSTYHAMRIDRPTSVMDVDGAQASTVVCIVDLLGRPAPTLTVQELPSGLWIVLRRTSTGIVSTTLVVPGL